MLHDIARHLRCPHGEPGLVPIGGSLVCPAGHRFDVARQGYVNLLTGRAPAGVDTAAMVAARIGFQQAGHQRPLTDALLEAVGGHATAGDVEPEPRAEPEPPAEPEPRVLVDLGAGPGHHLAALVEHDRAAVGLAVDLSKHAARRAARAHPRIGAIVADVWGELPVRDAVADVVLVVFAPRNAAEIGRILRPGGRLVVVTPAAGHLAPLVERLGLLQQGPAKVDHLDAAFDEVVELHERRAASWSRALSHEDALALVAMGPNAWHTHAEVAAGELEDLPDPVEVSFAVTVSVYRR